MFRLIALEDRLACYPTNVHNIDGKNIKPFAEHYLWPTKYFCLIFIHMRHTSEEIRSYAVKVVIMTIRSHQRRLGRG